MKEKELLQMIQKIVMKMMELEENQDMMAKVLKELLEEKNK